MKHIARQFGRLVMAANLLLVLALLLAYLSRYVSPQSSALLALVGLGYPVWFLGNVLFSALWLFSRKRKRALISLGALVLGWSVHMAFWNPIGGSSSPEASAGLSVVTYNVKLFDVIEQLESKIAGRAPTINPILSGAAPTLPLGIVGPKALQAGR